VADEKEERLRVEPLAPSHERSGIDSRVKPLDRYFLTRADQDARKNVVAPFVLLLPDGTIGSY
jgi:hypothetical protein